MTRAMPDPRTARRARYRRGALYLLLAAALGLGFWGYLSPGLRLHWETLVALCGF